MLFLLQMFQSNGKLIGDGQRVIKIVELQVTATLSRVEVNQSVDRILRPDRSANDAVGLKLLQTCLVGQPTVLFDVPCEDCFPITQDDRLQRV